jgi:hypothetical protein
MIDDQILLREWEKNIRQREKTVKTKENETCSNMQTRTGLECKLL